MHSVPRVRSPHGLPSRAWAGIVVSLTGIVCLVGLAGCGAGATPRATAIGTPTPTVAPYPTYTPPPPTPTPTTFEQSLAQLVQGDLGGLSQSTVVHYDSGAHSLLALVTIALTRVPDAPNDVSAAQEESKVICFRAERTLWTSAVTRSLALREVDVGVIGPTIDQYAIVTTGGYASASLSARVEARFAWATLTPDAAWGLYDFTFLRPEYNNAD